LILETDLANTSSQGAFHDFMDLRQEGYRAEPAVWFFDGSNVSPFVKFWGGVSDILEELENSTLEVRLPEGFDQFG
jgi:hypothetical protein